MKKKEYLIHLQIQHKHMLKFWTHLKKYSKKNKISNLELNSIQIINLKISVNREHHMQWPTGLCLLWMNIKYLVSMNKGLHNGEGEGALSRRL